VGPVEYDIVPHDFLNDFTHVKTVHLLFSRMPHHSNMDHGRPSPPIMQHYMDGGQQPDKPVYGCGKGPYDDRQSQYRHRNQQMGLRSGTRVENFSSFRPTVGGRDKPVYNSSGAAPYQTNSFGTYNHTIESIAADRDPNTAREMDPSTYVQQSAERNRHSNAAPSVAPSDYSALSNTDYNHNSFVQVEQHAHEGEALAHQPAFGQQRDGYDMYQPSYFGYDDYRNMQVRRPQGYTQNHHGRHPPRQMRRPDFDMYEDDNRRVGGHYRQQNDGYDYGNEYRQDQNGYDHYGGPGNRQGMRDDEYRNFNNALIPQSSYADQNNHKTHH
jgi:hypothetical protein